MVLVKNNLLILIVLLSALLRFWQLGTDPPSLYVDEVSLGYNAYSILKTGRDEYGQFMPLFFRSFDTYNPALSVYTLIPSIWVFGLNEIGVRFPSALLGTLSVFLIYFLAKNLTGDRKIAIFSALMLAISPWHIHFSRFYHEANITLFLTLLPVTLFLYFKNNFKFVVLASIIFGIGIYTSHIAKISIFLTVLCLALFYYKDLLKFRKKIVVPVVILLLFSIPILVNFDKSFKRGHSVSVFNEKNTSSKIVEGYLSHFSPVFLFISPDPIGRHAVGGMGHFYIFQIPLILIGIYSLLRKNDEKSLFLIVLILITPIAASLSTPTPHAGRSIPMSAYLSIVAGAGLFELVNTKIKKNIKIASVLLLTVIAAYNIATYLHLYYKHYPIERSLDWSGGYKELVSFVAQKEKNYQQIAVTNYYAQPYIYFLFYKSYDPKLYQQSGSQSGFSKYVFFPEGTWKSFETQPSTLVATTPSEGKKEEYELIKTFNEPVFKVWESN